uniref:Uncharacterized protein n=1 Tax=Panagrellus redivivus TaxID=6233 RepID=A0A7E4W177_PANRE
MTRLYYVVLGRRGQKQSISARSRLEGTGQWSAPRKDNKFGAYCMLASVVPWRGVLQIKRSSREKLSKVTK